MVKFAQLPKYEAYKDSGVEWLGEIPAHWQLLSLKRIVKEHSGNGFPIELQGQSGSIPFLKVSDIGGYGHFVESSNNYVSKKTINQKKWNVVPAGSLVTAKIGEAIRKNHRKLLIKDSIIDNNCIAFECIDVDIKFNFYMHLIIDFDWFVNPGAVPSISVSKYKAEKTAIPSINEQTLIANFLDQKTAQIDAAIAIKEQQIELLKERKQIIIQQAVTQGLDPNVPMKDSGVEWIGQIPEHWEVIKLKLLTNKIVDGAHFTPTYVDQGVPFLRVTDLTNMINGKINWEAVRYIPENEHKELIKRAKPEIGDVLLSKNGTIGLTKVIDWNEEFSIFVSLCLIKLKNSLRPEYFTAFFNSPIVDLQITFGSSRTSVTNLHLEKIKELLVILPPIEDQLKIVSYINQVSESYDPLIDVKLNQIKKLKEYKTTLINSAVTGKIKITPKMLQA